MVNKRKIDFNKKPDLLKDGLEDIDTPDISLKEIESKCKMTLSKYTVQLIKEKLKNIEKAFKYLEKQGDVERVKKMKCYKDAVKKQTALKHDLELLQKTKWR